MDNDNDPPYLIDVHNEWIPFKMKEMVMPIAVSLKQSKRQTVRRSRVVCEKCKNYLVRNAEDEKATSELCLAMPRMMEILSILKMPNNETQIPFEMRDTPLDCEFYAEQFMSQLENN